MEAQFDSKVKQIEGRHGFELKLKVGIRLSGVHLHTEPRAF